MMRSIEELRRAMRDETADLAPGVTFAQVRQRARRRRFAGLFAFAAGVLVPIGATMTVLSAGPGGPSPLPPPPSNVAPVMTPLPVPDLSEAVRTGIAYGPDEEFFIAATGDDMNGVPAGFYNAATGQFRRLELGLMTPEPGQFSVIGEFEDRHGGIVDYGVVRGAGLRVEVTADGQRVDATSTELPGLPGATVFWARRAGIAVGPTGAVGGPSPDLAFTARDAAGTVVATGGYVQRTDGQLVIADTSVQIGDLMPTGVILADGGKLVLWFSGDDRGTSLLAGSVHGAGAPTELRGLGRYARPPFDIGFYGGRQEFDQPGGTKVVLLTYVGPATEVTLTAPTSTGHGSVRWSAHPQLRIAWIAGVAAQDTANVTGVAKDARGTVIGTSEGR
ncbi:hypothetical protein [Dactylosporangium sp. NPDC005555]|uniref:hypothetical protein n=1 Tax=Dactylosporangium sp. NPDC005555 TaxID=3154889 RepID=UPI0033B2C7E0